MQRGRLHDGRRRRITVVHAVIHTPPLASTATGFDISIRASDTLGGEGASSYPLDPSGETAIPEVGKPARFFRLRATEEL